MSTQDKARELIAHDRQHEAHLHETMVSRATEEDTAHVPLEEKARERLVEERKHEEHLHETMVSRATPEGH